MFAKYLPLLLFPCITFAQDAEISPAKKLSGFGGQDITQKVPRDSSDVADNTRELAYYDSLKKSDVSKLDSIAAAFNHSVDSLKQASQAPLFSLQEKWTKLYKSKKTARGKRKKRIENKMDTVRNQMGRHIDTLNARITKLKSKTNKAIQKANLPPEASGEVEKLKGSLSQYALPVKSLNSEMGLSIPDLSSFSPLKGVSNLSLDKATPSGIGKLDVPGPDNITTDWQKPTNEFTKLSKLNSVDQGIEKVAEEKLKSQGIDAALTNSDNNLSAQVSQEIESQGKEVVNHFAGKEKELQEAMGKVSKYKEKYGSVKDVVTLPKHYNPLGEWKWWQRLTPGLLFFVQQRLGTYIDLAPYVGWRWNSRITSSAGWSERISIHRGTLGVGGHDRIHGLTSSVSYSWKHGLAFRILPEYMQSFVTEGNPLKSASFAWRWRLLAGIRKDFSLYKKMLGYTEVSYNFLRTRNTTIFGDAFFIRFGVEWRIREQ